MHARNVAQLSVSAESESELWPAYRDLLRSLGPYIAGTTLSGILAVVPVVIGFWGIVLWERQRLDQRSHEVQFFADSPAQLWRGGNPPYSLEPGQAIHVDASQAAPVRLQIGGSHYELHRTDAKYWGGGTTWERLLAFMLGFEIMTPERTGTASDRAGERVIVRPVVDADRLWGWPYLCDWETAYFTGVTGAALLGVFTSFLGRWSKK